MLGLRWRCTDGSMGADTEALDGVLYRPNFLARQVGVEPCDVPIQVSPAFEGRPYCSSDTVLIRDRDMQTVRVGPEGIDSRDDLPRRDRPVLDSFDWTLVHQAVLRYGVPVRVIGLDHPIL